MNSKYIKMKPEWDIQMKKDLSAYLPTDEKASLRWNSALSKNILTNKIFKFIYRERKRSIVGSHSDNGIKPIKPFIIRSPHFWIYSALLMLV